MNKKERAFIETVRDFYEKKGRHSLPWRKTADPYKILVSEVMLQQTQVDRALPKYRSFLKAFPSVQILARASLGEVLKAWQGLGYNRRAKMLHACAQYIAEKRNGKFPKTKEDLEALPGVGPYTAGAILAFSYNTPVVLIETNVRAVFLHHFFTEGMEVHDAELLPLIAHTLDATNPREWYWALMDYGSFIKKKYGNPNVRSRHYGMQSVFKGSDRQIRGGIVRLLAEKARPRKLLLEALNAFDDIRVDAQIERLVEEKMIVRKGSLYQLP